MVTIVSTYLGFLKPKVIFWKMQRKTWYSILGVEAMPLFLKNLPFRSLVRRSGLVTRKWVSPNFPIISNHIVLISISNFSVKGSKNVVKWNVRLYIYCKQNSQERKSEFYEEVERTRYNFRPIKNIWNFKETL